MRRTNVRFNYRDYLQLPEDKRYEIIDGELYAVPSPNTRHQRLSQKLETALIEHAEGSGIGWILHAPYDVIFSEENILQPDILLVRQERAAIIGEANLQGAPDLVIEILSPATRSKDLNIKRKIYASFEVQEYWIVDPDAETIEVLVWSGPDYVRAGVYGKPECLSSPLLPGFELSLGDLFEKV